MFIKKLNVIRNTPITHKKISNIPRISSPPPPNYSLPFFLQNISLGLNSSGLVFQTRLPPVNTPVSCHGTLLHVKPFVRPTKVQLSALYTDPVLGIELQCPDLWHYVLFPIHINLELSPYHLLMKRGITPLLKTNII